VFDASVGVGETLFGGAGFWGGGAAAAPLVGVLPLSAGASGAGATDIAAVASSKVAAGGAWSGEWSGDAWTGSSDAWLGTGDAAGATGASGSDASFADSCERAARLCDYAGSMRCRSYPLL